MSHVIRACVASGSEGSDDYPYVMNDGLLPQTFANLIRTSREAKGWSQDQLAQAAADEHGEHVSVSTISRWERGQAGRPEPAHVRTVCKALGIDPRRAAVSLGYLTAEEVSDVPPPPDPEIEEVLQLLPEVSADERRHWIQYLKYLKERRELQKRGKNVG